MTNPTTEPTSQPSSQPIQRPTGVPTTPPTPVPTRGTYTVITFSVKQTVNGMSASDFDDDNVKNAYIQTVASSMGVDASSIKNFQASRRRILFDNINLQSSVQLSYAVSVIAEAISSGADPSQVYAQLSSSLSEAMADSDGFAAQLTAALAALDPTNTAFSNVQVLTPQVSQPTISVGGNTKAPTPEPSFAPTTLISTSFFKNTAAGAAAAFVALCLIVLAYVNKKKLPFVTFTSSKGAFDGKKVSVRGGTAPTLLTLDDLLGEENTTKKIIQSNKQASTRTRSNSPPRNKLSSLGQPKHSQFTTISYEPNFQNVDLTAESRRAAQDILSSWGVDDDSIAKK